MPAQARSLTFAIHELNPWGGHDRSTLEIARNLSHQIPLEISSYSIVDPKGQNAWGHYTFRPIRPYIKKPAFFLITYFYFNSLWRFWMLPKFQFKQRPLIHATGACSLISDVIQVQFVNTAWKHARDRIEKGYYQAPHSRSGSLIKSKLIKLYHEFMLNYDRAIESLVYKPDKTYIAIAHSVAKELKDYFGVKANVHVIHHGVDPLYFHPPNDEQTRQDREAIRKSLSVAENELVIAFVGAFERKGLAVAIDALALLEPSLRKKVRLMAVGSGDAQGFKERAKAHGIEDRLIIVGHTKEVVRYYRAGDAFLLPTLYEPFGLVILEAMACGLPPIVSRLAGGAELIREGESGLLIESPTDAHEIAGHLAKLIENPELRKKLGENARAVAEKRTWERVAQEYAAVLEPLLLK